MCKNCSIRPVIILESGIKKCRGCFIKYFEKKALNTIRKFELIENNDHLVVGVSGGKDSLSVLNLMIKIAEKRRKIKVEGLLIDEGIKGYRANTVKDAKKFCKDYKVKLTVISYKKEFGMTLDQMVKKVDVNPCTVCGVLRRYLLNKYSRKLKATKLVTGHNMDDEAQAVIMNQFKQNIETSARLGPITGVIKDKAFVRRVKPFYVLSEKEVALYAILKGFIDKYVECPYAKRSFRADVRDMLNDFESKHRGTKSSVIQSFLKILPLLKKNIKGKPLNYCKKCKEPCGRDICKTCELLGSLK